MVELSETDMREMLERRAADFGPAAVPVDTIFRKARRRRARNLALVSATTFAVVALVGGLLD
jgi:hypothetical protein